MEAFAQAVGDRDARLVLVGDGPDQDECRRLAKAHRAKQKKR